MVGVVAVSKVDFQVEAGLITGPHRAPTVQVKTTLFNNMTGLDLPSSGKVYFNNKDITGYPAHKICRMGIARTFQNIRLFKELSVVENVMIGRHFKTGKDATHGRFLNALKSYIYLKQEEQEIYEKADNWLDFFDMSQFQERTCQKPSLWTSTRELEIARALATDPKLLFLDEPAAWNESSGNRPSDGYHKENP